MLRQNRTGRSSPLRRTLTVEALEDRTLLDGNVTAVLNPSLLLQPARAITRALERAGRSLDEVDLFEINEAFASVVLSSLHELGVDDDTVNVNGGAIAFGHPIGASGARLPITLVAELRRRGGGLGAAGLCGGGGQGDAIVLEVRP